MTTTDSGPQEAETWVRAVSGDPEAFGAIFDLHRDRVFGHSLRLVGSVPDAEDVTALVFLEAWRRRAAVRVVDGSIIGWLLVTANYVVRNQSRTLHRHQIAMAKFPPAVPQSDHADSVLLRLDDRARSSHVRSAFAQLSQRDQDVLTLCVLEELSLTHAAIALRVPIGTVKSRLSRAKRRLAGHLAAGPGGVKSLEGFPQ